VTLAPFTRPWLRRRLNVGHPALLLAERYVFGGRRYGKIVSVSHGVKREIMALYGVPDGDIVVIPNGVNLDEFAVDAARGEGEALRSALGITPHDHVLLLVANEFPRKGLGVLLDALALLPPSIHLVCVGKGNPRPYLATVAERNLERRVHFVPHTTTMRAYYAASDIFAFPTQYEAFSLATLEAAGAGLPLLCTRVNGTEELVVDGHNGLFVEREGRDIADKVRWMLAAPERVRALGQAAHETARAYQWPAIKDQHVRLYEEILDGKRVRLRAAAPRTPGHRSTSRVTGPAGEERRL
jgi:UDP-glucose:(heptosyl)LPS alpha-1,3-glucosyltransferase